MKRIVLSGAVLAALITGGITTAAMAATTHSAGHAKTTPTTKTVYVRAVCRLALTTVAPRNSTAVEPGSAKGTNFGASRCAAPLRDGTAQQSFTNTASGRFHGTIQQWFNGGTVYGYYALKQTLNSGPPTATTFNSARFFGTVTITGARGGLKGVSGHGTMSCKTVDSVHYKCTERLHLHETVTVLATS